MPRQDLPARAPIEGVIAGIITPFGADGSIALEELRKETAVLSHSPVDSLCVGGLLSDLEGAPPEEFFSVCETVCRHSPKPVVAMIAPDSQPEAIELARAAESGGVRALLVAQPHYLCQPGAAGLSELFARLRRETRLALVIANCQRNAMIGLAAMRQLISDGAVDGVLLGGDGAHLMVDLLCARPGVPVLSAMEDLHYVNLLLGASGIVSDLAALCPGEAAGLYRAFREGNYAHARLCHERLVRLWRVFDHPSEQRARLRSALMSQGRKVGTPRSPYNVSCLDSQGEILAAIEREGISAHR